MLLGEHTIHIGHYIISIGHVNEMVVELSNQRQSEKKTAIRRWRGRLAALVLAGRRFLEA